MQQLESVFNITDVLNLILIFISVTKAICGEIYMVCR